MNAMLADDIDGGIFVILILLVVGVTCLLALGALFPAAKGDCMPALALSIPAFLAGILVTAWLAVGFISDRMHETQIESFRVGLSYLAMPWLVMAGPPFATGLLALSVLWFNKHKRA